ncbi:unnamed protein product [Cyprideis torosa]|uniref:Protein KRI1 homolog n=1 Tax=Cyprideis torosa TaxID=163714 RepID=A0A7R8ZR05_9CRUS|nr:unnamed protein product [Cyprideis torosa]CAG0893188.1 unnamed protein product [Cyprideis torosa]
MRGCCSCSCCPLKPRYKELVDNIFPSNPEEGLRKANMDKLTFYAVSSPEKLDRIGEYIAQRVNRDILSKRKQGFVLIAMEAMDQLLLTCCHSKTLNIFVQSFLKTVQKLLECTEPQLQILASQSFIKFANIQEETPTYHLRFDFFVSKFCSMCHDGSTSLETRAGLRRAGLNGIHGVVRKTVSEELVESIWEPAHMDKIIPSLLFNMFDGVEDFDDLHRNEDDSPAALAETTLRELVGRAPYGKLETVMKACLMHLDSHHLWWPNNAFAVHVFRVILFAIQARYSQVVMQLLMRHLEAVDGAVGGKKRSSGVRMGIADVIRRTITIAASETVGLSPLEIINSLLNHLRRSVERKGELEKGRTEEALEEEDYQGTLINAMGEYTTHLPDYQKIEILKFVMGKVPLGPVGNGDTPDRRRSSSGIAAEVKPNVQLQKILLRSMLKSFLKTVQKLLECTEPQLQILASQSFIKFANIQEETPTYHLRFDFFVSKFCSMCHDGSTSLETRAGLRRAGLNGIHGVVRKTVSEELVESIWEPAHMDKIIPSLLFNMFDGVEDFDDLHRNEDDSPAALAETTLRELVGRAPYGKLETVMKACLHHLDSHHLWWPNNAFAVHVFRVILFAIQARYSQVVMQLLMRHLEAVDGAVGGKKRSSGVRMGIADVIRRTITIAASETVGLSPLEIINSLLNHLRRSVERKGELEKGRTEEALEEEDYQGTLINAMGEYTTHLPDYQKIEILKFVMGKVPLGPVGNGDTPDRRRSSSGIAAEVKPNVQEAVWLALRSTALAPGGFPVPIFSLVNWEALTGIEPWSVSPRELELETEKCSSNDLQFFKRRGPDLLAALYAGATLENNTEENLSAIVVSVCLLCLEINSADTMVEVIRLCLNLQELALRTTESISVSHRFCLHAAIAAVMAMVGYLCHNHSAPLRHHIEETISLRVEHCPHLLPPLRASYPVSHPVTGPDLPLFKKDVITEALQDAGLDPRPLEAPISSRSNLLLQPPGGKPRSGSSDLQVDCESGGSSSPGRRRSGAFAGDSSSTDNEDGDGGSQKEGEQVTLESLRKVLQEPLSKQKEALAEKARQVAQLYQSASFTELLARKSSSDNLHAKLEEIFANEPLSCIGGVPEDGSGDSLSTPGDRNSVGVNIPDLYAGVIVLMGSKKQKSFSDSTAEKKTSGKALFAESDDEENEPRDEGLRVNKEYAQAYVNWREKEELQKLKDRYGDPTIEELEGKEDEDSSSESSEDGGFNADSIPTFFGQRNSYRHSRSKKPWFSEYSYDLRRRCQSLRRLALNDSSWNIDFTLARTAYHRHLRAAKKDHIRAQTEDLVFSAKREGLKAFYGPARKKSASCAIPVHDLRLYCFDLYSDAPVVDNVVDRIPSCDVLDHPLLSPSSEVEVLSVLKDLRSKAKSASSSASPYVLSLLEPRLGELLTRDESPTSLAWDKGFFRALSALKEKDPRIYDSKVRFYDDEEAEPSKEKKKGDKSSKKKKTTIKDYEREMVLAGTAADPEGIEGSSNDRKREFKTYVEEQEELKRAFKTSDDSDSDDADNLLVERKRTAEEKQREDEAFKEWLKGEKGVSVDSTTEKELAGLKRHWNKKRLDEGEAFLKDYILNERFREEDDDEVPDYDEIVGDGNDLSEDERIIEKQEAFEHKYNFRFEEPDQEFIKRYPRTVGSSLRQEKKKRKEKRSEIKERKEKEKRKVREEVEHLKKLKKKEILEKIDKLREVSGESEGWEQRDVEGDFDPAEHDRRMKELFGDEYYGEDEANADEKPVFEYDEEIDGDIPDWDAWTKERGDTETAGNEDTTLKEESCDDDIGSEKGKDFRQEILKSTQTKRKKRRRKGVLAKVLEKEKPAFDPERHKDFQKYFDEYYAMDFEDLIGDVKCRFKYRQVLPNDFGLSVNEILAAEDKELNKWASLKKTCQYRTDSEEKYDKAAYRNKASNTALKTRLLPSVFSPVEEPTATTGRKRPIEGDPDHEEGEGSNAEQAGNADEGESKHSDGKTKKKRKKKASSKQSVASHVMQLMSASSVGESVGQKEIPRKRKSEKDKRKVKPSATEISDERLAAFGLNPKKFKNKLKYAKRV